MAPVATPYWYLFSISSRQGCNPKLHCRGQLQFRDNFFHCLASLIAQLVKNLPAMQETLARFLGWEYPMEKG